MTEKAVKTETPAERAKRLTIYRDGSLVPQLKDARQEVSRIDLLIAEVDRELATLPKPSGPDIVVSPSRRRVEVQTLQEIKWQDDTDYVVAHGRALKFAAGAFIKPRGRNVALLAPQRNALIYGGGDWGAPIEAYNCDNLVVDGFKIAVADNNAAIKIVGGKVTCRNIGFSAGRCFAQPSDAEVVIENLESVARVISNLFYFTDCRWTLRNVQHTGGSVEENGVRSVGGPGNLAEDVSMLGSYRGSPWRIHGGGPHRAVKLHLSKGPGFGKLAKGKGGQEEGFRRYALNGKDYAIAYKDDAKTLPVPLSPGDRGYAEQLAKRKKQLGEEVEWIEIDGLTVDAGGVEFNAGLVGGVIRNLVRKGNGPLIGGSWYYPQKEWLLTPDEKRCVVPRVLLDGVVSDDDQPIGRLSVDGLPPSIGWVGVRHNGQDIPDRGQA